MSNQPVSIVRAKGLPSCVLFNGKKAIAVGAENHAPLAVTVSEAADLIERDPSDWTCPVAADLALVKAEIKQRADAAKSGGN